MMRCTNPVKTFPFKKRIDTELFISKTVALFIVNETMIFPPLHVCQYQFAQSKFS